MDILMKTQNPNCFQVLELNLQLDPEQIKELANKIDETVSQLENVDTIIEETRADLEHATQLQERSATLR